MGESNPMDALVSVAASIPTPSTKRRIQIFSNEIPFIISNVSGSLANMEHLPEEIIQHILSFLERKEAIRVSVVCKKFYSAWSLHPILKFHHDELCSKIPASTTCYRQVREEFVNYVNKPLERYLSHNQIPQQLDLTLNCERYASASPMIAKVLQKFEEAGVRAIRVFYTSANERYSAETNLFRVLQCKALVEFNVQRCNLIMKNERIGNIRCLLLKRLILRDLLTDDDTIQSIISACSLIEKLYLRRCYNLRRIKVVNHCCLKEVNFAFVRYTEDREFEVQVPSLESLFVGNVGLLRGLELYPYPNMKTVSLGRVSIADSFFWDFSSKFPNLENFTAIDCIGYKGGNISGNSLKSVTLKTSDSYTDRRQPEINAPNLVSFIYECSEIPRFVSTIASSRCECKLNIEMKCLLLHGSDSFFIQLKETLKRIMKSKLSLFIAVNSISNTENLEWSSNASDDEPGFEVEGLTLYKIKAEDVTSSRTYSSFVDSLFWSCRPKSICLHRFADSSVDFDMEFGKVFCERLMDRRSKSKFGGWENDLKEVKVEFVMIDVINNRETQLVSIEDWRTLGAIRSQLLLSSRKPRMDIAFFIRLEW